MKFRRCTDDRSSYDDLTFVLQKITIKVGLKLWRLHRLQVQIDFIIYQPLLPPNYCWLIFFFFLFLSVPEFQTTPTIPLPIMNIFIIFFVKEKKKSYYPSIFILKCEINRKIDMAAKKCYYLFESNLSSKFCFFLTS